VKREDIVVFKQLFGWNLAANDAAENAVMLHCQVPFALPAPPDCARDPTLGLIVRLLTQDRLSECFFFKPGQALATGELIKHVLRA